MHYGPLADTLRLRDEIARSLLDEENDRDEAAEQSTPTRLTPQSGDGSRAADDGSAQCDRSDEVDLLTGGGLPSERR
jgi:hypothetical protein